MQNVDMKRVFHILGLIGRGLKGYLRFLFYVIPCVIPYCIYLFISDWFKSRGLRKRLANEGRVLSYEAYVGKRTSTGGTTIFCQGLCAGCILWWSPRDLLERFESHSDAADVQNETEKTIAFCNHLRALVRKKDAPIYLIVEPKRKTKSKVDIEELKQLGHILPAEVTDHVINFHMDDYEMHVHSR